MLLRAMHAPALSPGQTLGRYRIEGPLGAGGMGEVFRAWDATLRRWVALKVVPRDGTGRAERLLAEARAAAMLKHANLVSVFDVGETDGVAFVSMDLVEGRSLRDSVGDRSVPMDQRILWLQQIASAIAAAHRAGIVHRDVKPENVMIDAQGQARVLDFGLAKFVSVDVAGPTGHATQGPPSFRTHEGRIVGTPAYMAPEQLAGGPPSPSWDQYAFGLLAYELLCGMHPRASGLISADGWAQPLDTLAPVPPTIAHAVISAMAPSSDRRFATMDAVVAALGGAPSGTSLPQPTPGAALAGSMPPWPSAPGGSSTAATAVHGRGSASAPVHPTLPTVAHAPSAPHRAVPASRSVLPFLLGVAVTLLVVSSIAGVAIWRLRSVAVQAPPALVASATASAPPPVPTLSATAAPVVASVAPAPTRPPVVPRPGTVSPTPASTAGAPTGSTASPVASTSASARPVTKAS
jgi:serine/threonine-protein kinase